MADAQLYEKQFQLSDRDFTNVSFCWHNFSDQSAERSRFILCDFSNTSLKGTNFSHSDLFGSVIGYTDISEADFFCTNLIGVTMVDVVGWEKAKHTDYAIRTVEDLVLALNAASQGRCYGLAYAHRFMQFATTIFANSSTMSYSEGTTIAELQQAVTAVSDRYPYHNWDQSYPQIIEQAETHNAAHILTQMQRQGNMGPEITATMELG